MTRPALVLAALAWMGCDERENGRPSSPDLTTRGVETVAATFEELYPTFLWRKSMSEGEKASLWTRYRGRWVRWEGVIASVTDKGITLKHLRTTVTFDVSLICEASVMVTLRQRFAVGDRVRYIGMLSSYDDIFRTLYLTHGAVLEKVPHGDLGVPADMAHAVP